MENSQIVVIGTGPDARIALDVFQAAGGIVLGIASDPAEASESSLNDVSVFAPFDSKDARKVITGSYTHYLIAVGDIVRRKELAEKLEKITDRAPATGVHPMAFVSQYARLGAGNLVNAGAVINANVFVGNHNLIHSLVSIEPDAIIGDFCTLSAGVRVGGACRIGNEVFIGTGAVIYPGIKIGDGAKIGAGAVVLREVRAGGTVFGNPAQEAGKS